MSKKTTVPNDIHLPFQKLEKEIGSVVLERREEAHTAILALLGKQHHFCLGTPGIAKSMLVDELVKRIGGATKFEILFNQYMDPAEIFGGPNIKQLVDHGTMERVITGMLPEAEIFFGDEIFKAGPALLNTLLKALHERKFVVRGGVVMDMPLHSGFFASNELPTGNELLAIWDRLHFRHQSSSLMETSNFVAMLGMTVDPNPPVIITMDQLKEAHALVRTVELPETVLKEIVKLKARLRDAGINVTDRRWKEATRAIRSEAFYQGHMIASPDDLRPLMHMLWSETGEIATVHKFCREVANPLEQEATKLLEDLDEAHRQAIESVGAGENPAINGELVVQMYKKLQLAKGELQQLKDKQIESGREIVAINALNDKIMAIGAYVMDISMHGKKNS